MQAFQGNPDRLSDANHGWLLSNQGNHEIRNSEQKNAHAYYRLYCLLSSGGYQGSVAIRHDFSLHQALEQDHDIVGN